MWTTPSWRTSQLQLPFDHRERAMQLKPREQDKGFWTSTRYFDTQSPFVDSYLTFQSVLLSPHDVDQRVLQRMHVKAVEWTGTILWGEKRRMGIKKKPTTMAFLISLSSAGVSLSSTIKLKLLCFCSSQRTISCWKEVTNERLNRGSRSKYKSNLVLTTHLTPISCG